MDGDEQFPAIMEYNPYRRIKKPVPDYRDEYPPVVPFLAERGYVIVQFDVRGTGKVNGKYYFEKSWSVSVPRELS